MMCYAIRLVGDAATLASWLSLVGLVCSSSLCSCFVADPFCVFGSSIFVLICDCLLVLFHDTLLPESDCFLLGCDDSVTIGLSNLYRMKRILLAGDIGDRREGAEDEVILLLHLSIYDINSISMVGLVMNRDVSYRIWGKSADDSRIEGVDGL